MTVKPRERPAETEEDPVENMLKKTGCIELHYKVQVPLFNFKNRYDEIIFQSSETNCLLLLYFQECIATTRDWRKCQTEVNEFKDCINKHKQEERKPTNLNSYMIT